MATSIEVAILHKKLGNYIQFYTINLGNNIAVVQNHL